MQFAPMPANIQKVAALGKVRLPEVTGISDWGWFGILIAVAAVAQWFTSGKDK